MLDFLGLAREEKLAAALTHMKISGVVPGQISALEWLLSSRAKEPGEIVAALDQPDPVLRKYGAVAAARLAGHVVRTPKGDVGPLLHASESNDPDIKKFAEFAYRLHKH